MSDININNLDIYEFEISDQEFTIQYNKTDNEWSAINFDEDKYDYDITFDQESFENGSLELFDQYKLNLELFKKLIEVTKEK